MNKYKYYKEYKKVEIDWITEIPKNWDIFPAFSVAKEECLKNKNGIEDNVLSLSYGNIIKRDIETNFGLLPESFNTYQLVFNGNIILRLTDLQNDQKSLRVGFATQNGIITSAYLKLVFRNKLNSKYAYFLLHYYDLTKVFYGMGGGLRQSMKFDDLRRLPIITPSLLEQEKIVNFLDHETKKIDQLIAKQEQLIELLKEKRQAVISHAVTKGLNPKVKMKDSGVEWLGEVPEHWNVTKIKYLIKTFEQGWSPQCEARLSEDNEYGVLKVGCVNSGKFNPLEHKALPSDLEPQKKYLINKGDLLISRANSKELVGSSAVAEQDYKYLILCDKLYRLIFKKSISPFFISEFLRTVPVRRQIELGASGASSSMQNIGQDTIKEMPIALPPQEETDVIINYIRTKIQKFDTLINLANQQIIFLKERRSALISAAVTGKIDVRDWQPPKDLHE